MISWKSTLFKEEWYRFEGEAGTQLADERSRPGWEVDIILYHLCGMGWEVEFLFYHLCSR